jgi:DNA-binding transcriptional regulator YiaG
MTRPAPFSDSERSVSELLDRLGQYGILDTALTDEDLGRLITAAPKVSLSARFTERAQAAIADACSKRERRHPALTLGTTIGQARIQSGLSQPELANQIGVPALVLEALEEGRLSVRQILRSFSPSVAVRLLTTIRLSVKEFTDRVMDLAASGNRATVSISARVPGRQSRQDTTTLIAEVAEYATTIERLAESAESPL